jgi:hypothetical protein
MFEQETIFVLGAGASWHYGYPTGEGLVEDVISMARRFSRYCDNRLKCGQIIQYVPEYVSQKMKATDAVGAWTNVRDECNLFVDRLESVRPLLIDYFLAWNEDLRPIGRLMIAAAILECEARWLKLRANDNRRLLLCNNPMKPSPEQVKRLDITKHQDEWYRFIVHKLVVWCRRSVDLLNNKIQFVTFNCDTSLEYHLFRALMAIDLLKRDDVERFLIEDRIVHVYGKVHEAIPIESDAIDLEATKALGVDFSKAPNYEKEFGGPKEFLDQCSKASESLRTIDPVWPKY